MSARGARERGCWRYEGGEMSNTVESGIRLVRLVGTLLLCVLAELAVLGAGIAAAPVAATADMTCVGDCNENRVVTVDELVTAVQIALASRAVDDCLADDPDLNRSVSVNELVAAVNSLLNGCLGGPTPVVSGTVTAATSTRTADATPGGPTSTPNPAGSPTATAGTRTPGSPTSTPNPLGSPTATASSGTAGSPTSTPNSVGSRTPTSAGTTPGATSTASPVDTPPGTSDEKLPRLVGAASASNTAIIVQFSKQMSDSVKNPGNYVITQEHVNPEAGHLMVTAADFFKGDPYTVKLTTLSQNEVTYRLRVVNVRDVLNNPLAQIQVVGGVIVDSSSAVFPGSGGSCGPRTCGNGSSGVGGMGLCSSDADCPCPADAPPTCTSTNACGCELRDGDGDGVPDNVEQLGWVVTVHNTDGTTTTREVTADPGLEDTDGDGLDDKTELQIGSDPRRVDTDGDGLSDYEEYNVIYSDPTNQDTDGDGNDDKLEVEFFKTNPLLADSDGDGFSDSEELYQINGDPRIADLPQPDFSVGEVRLQINEQFTYTDENGETHTEDSNTQTSLVTGHETSHATTTDVLAGFNVVGGISPCGADGGPCKAIGSAPLVLGTVFYQHETQDTDASDDASQRAFQSSLDKAQSFSTDSTVTRQIVGARVDVAVTLANKSDVAVTLSNLEITALTTDPQDSAKFIPLATLLPDSQQQSGTSATFNIGPGESRGPIIFSNTQVFPNLVEELMKAPHGLIFKVANYDLTTGDGRNFAFGLQAVRERTVNVTVDFGDGTVKQANAITAPVLNRPRDEMRCAPGGDHPDYACASDADCGTSTPCQGGQVIGGLSKYGGTGTPAGIPLDFVLRDIMHLRKMAPPAILAGKDGISVTHAQEDDVQVVPVCEDLGHCPVGTSGLRPDTVVVAPGRNGVLDTVPATRGIQNPDVDTSNVSSQGAAILAGPDGVADTVACPKNHCIQDASLHCLNSGDCVDDDGIFHACIHPTYCDDLQVVAPGTRNLASDAIVVAARGGGVLSGLLSTRPSGDDVISGPDGILAGPNGIVESVAQGDDVQLVPVGTTGVPEDTVAIAAGQNGILDTPHLGDDVADVVTGYEVSKTCDYNTLAAIVAGHNTTADTTVESGMCTTGFPPHFAGERGCRSNQDCGRDPARPATCTTAVLPHVVGEHCEADADCGSAATPGVCTGSFGVCSSDVQVENEGDSVTSASTAIILPRDGSSLTYVRSVAPVSSDDQYVGPGIPCTTDLDCTVIVEKGTASVPAGTYPGSCSGPSTVVRVDNRRNGQFRRFWAVLTNKTDIVQTDFSQIMVRPGDAIDLSFIQDADRDGLIAQEEFLHGTSDFNRDTDGDDLDDFEEIRLGWEVGAVGQALRRVFPDPRNADSDGDGLTDREEKDLRLDQCACDAIGPKTLLGSGNLLRGQSGNEVGGRPCTGNADCVAGGVCRDTVHCTYADYLLHRPCPTCDTDQTLHRTDPRLRDTDGDRVSDFDEVFGFRTGTGIFSAPLVGGPGTGFVPEVVVTGNGVAHTRACPSNHCQEDAAVWCQTDGDCEGSHQCIHPVACDDVQVVDPGTGGLAANTVVVAPGPYTTYHGRLSPTAGSGDIFITTQRTHGNQGAAIDNNASQAKALENAQPNSDDEQIVPRGQLVFDEASLQCADGSAFATATGITGLPLRFAMCGIIKPGPDGRIQTTAQNAPGALATSTLHNVLVPADSGQKIEVTDPLNPDTDGDEIADGFERILGSSPNDATDTGLTADTDEDGLSDNIEKTGWTVSITGLHPSSRIVASNPYVQDTDADGIPDYAEAHMPCRNDLTHGCPTDPTAADTDGDGLSDYDELSAAQLTQLEALNGFFAGYHIDGSNSKHYGSDPNNPDTDLDGLTDGAEILTPFYLSVPGESVVRTAFTNPLDPDTDHDGLKDNVEEQTYHTDPSDPDTDADKRLDGREVELGANPLVKDTRVTVTFTEFRLTNGPSSGPAWEWAFNVQTPTDSFPGHTLSDASTSARFVGSCVGGSKAGQACSTLADCPGGSNCNGGQKCFGFSDVNYIPTCGGRSGLNVCPFPNRTLIYFGNSNTLTFTLHAGQGFVVNGRLVNYSNCSSRTISCGDNMEFIEPYTFESVTGFVSKTETLVSTGCGGSVTYEITTD